MTDHICNNWRIKNFKARILPKKIIELTDCKIKWSWFKIIGYRRNARESHARVVAPRDARIIDRDGNRENKASVGSRPLSRFNYDDKTRSSYSLDLILNARGIHPTHEWRVDYTCY